MNNLYILCKERIEAGNHWRWLPFDRVLPTLLLKFMFGKAKSLMFFAAFTSLSWECPQFGQVHSRLLSCKSCLTYPQFEQVLEDVTYRPILMTFLPCHSALYVSMPMNMFQAKSPIARFIACLFSLCMSLIDKSSMQNVSTWLSLHILLVNLSRKSFLCHATLACSFVICSYLLLYLVVPFSNFARSFWCLVSFSWECFKNFGFSTFVPSSKVKNVFTPKSIPLEVSLKTGFFSGIYISTSQRIEI